MATRRRVVATTNYQQQRMLPIRTANRDSDRMQSVVVRQAIQLVCAIGWVLPSNHNGL